MLAWLVAPALRAQGGGSVLALPDPTREQAAAILARHVAALGGDAAIAAAGDVEVLGRLVTPAGEVLTRTLIRRAPFAVREEHRLAPDGPADLFVTDLRHAWELHEGGAGEQGASGAGEPHGHVLPFDDALPLVLRAWAWRLMLDPRATASTGTLALPFVMPPAPRVPAGLVSGDMADDRQTLTLVARGPQHLSPNLWFDAEDGRWLGWQLGPLDGGLQRLRVGRWTPRGDLMLPAVLVDFDEQVLKSVRVVEELRSGLSLDGGLFAGAPPPPLSGPQDVAPLRVSPAGVPGWGHLIVGGAGVNRQGPWWAHLDTGATRPLVHPALADSLALPFAGPARFTVLAGETVSRAHWIDELALGGMRWQQLVAITGMPLPMMAQPAQHQPTLIIGMELLAGLAPVIDLAAGRLRLRGPAPPTLIELAALESPGTPPPTVARTRLEDLDAEGLSWSVALRVGERSVRALFDTGNSATLRLSAAGLGALGLPTGRAAWLARGGQPYAMHGIGGAVLPDLLVRLDELVLPAIDARDGTPLDITWTRPWVVVSTAEDAASEPSAFAAILGTGALLSFDRIAFDDTQGQLELQPGARIRRVTTAQGDRLVIPAPGEYLGLLLRHPDAASPLPRLVEVVSGSLAHRAGLRVGDVLEQLDGEACANVPLEQLWPRLWMEDRDSLRLRVLRDGQPVSVELR